MAANPRQRSETGALLRNCASDAERVAVAVCTGSGADVREGLGATANPLVGTGSPLCLQGQAPIISDLPGYHSARAVPAWAPHGDPALLRPVFGSPLGVCFAANDLHAVDPVGAQDGLSPLQQARGEIAQLGGPCP